MPTTGEGESYDNRAVYRSYNAAGLQTSISNRKDGKVIADEICLYYLNGNKESANDLENNNYAYTYDGLGRLTQATMGNTAYAYSYDPRSNRQSQTVTENDSTVTTQYAYNLNNQLLQSVEKSGTIEETTNYAYDPRGNLHSKLKSRVAPADGVTEIGLSETTSDYAQYTYDSFERLTEVTENGKKAAYSYDPLGRRQSKTVDGHTEEYVLDRGNVVGIAEPYRSRGYVFGPAGVQYETDGSFLRRYYYKNTHGDVVKTEDWDTLNHIQQMVLTRIPEDSRYDLDGDGEVDIFDAAAYMRQQNYLNYSYDPFGTPKAAPDSELAIDNNPFRYCGEQYDQESGNIYLRARYYSPGAGRFTSEDPARDGLNWYVYCGNNPIRYTDPTGYWAKGDEKLPSWAQNEIRWLTSVWENGNANDKAWASSQANSIRNRAKAVELALYYDDKTSYDNGFHYYDSNVNSSDGSDCTNFISVCLNGAGINMNDDWYWKSYSTGGVRGVFGKSTTDASASWLRPDEFYRHFSDSERSNGVAYMAKGSDFSSVPRGAMPGDIIAYSNFDDVEPGYINHLGIITSIQSDGIHFSGHTNSRTDESLAAVLGRDYNGDIYIIRMKY